MRRLFLFLTLVGLVSNEASVVARQRETGSSLSGLFTSSSSSSKASSGELTGDQKQALTYGFGGLSAAYFLFKIFQIGYRVLWMYDLYWKLQPTTDLINEEKAYKNFYLFNWRVNDTHDANFWDTPKAMRDADRRDVIQTLFDDIDTQPGEGQSVFIFTDRNNNVQHVPVFADVSANGRDICDGRVPDLPTLRALLKSVNDEVKMLRNHLNDLRSASLWILGNFYVFNREIERHLLKCCGDSVSSIMKIDQLDSDEIDAARDLFLQDYPCWTEAFGYKRWVAKLYFDTAVAYSRAVALQDKVKAEVRAQSANSGVNRIPEELNNLEASFVTFQSRGAAGVNATDFNQLVVLAGQGRGILAASWAMPTTKQQQIIDDVIAICNGVDAAIDDFNRGDYQKAYDSVMVQRSLYKRVYKDLAKEF